MDEKNLWGNFDGFDFDDVFNEINKDILDSLLKETVNAQNLAEKQQQYIDTYQFQPQEFREFEIRMIVAATVGTARKFPSLPTPLLEEICWLVLNRIHEGLHTGEFGWFN